MFKTSISLVIIGGVCGALLVGTNLLTGPQIKQNRETRARALMADMLKRPVPTDIDVQRATFGRCPQWWFDRVHTQGYAGDIEVLALWQSAGRELTLRITNHRETPGIGDFIDHTRDPWVIQFDRQPLTSYDNFDNVSGATITSDAIRRAATKAQQSYEETCGQS